MSTITYRIDIDGTIAEPRFFDDDFQSCVNLYVRAGILKQEDVTSLQYHQQVFLLPHVLITHQTIAGAVEALQSLVAQGNTLQYFTIRQNFDPDICKRVHENTRVWLDTHSFPYPTEVRFFWNPAGKWLKSLEAPEERVVLIDDRVEGLLKAYQRIVQNDPFAAQRIRERVILVPFTRHFDVASIPAGLQVIPLSHWSTFHDVRIQLERSFSNGSGTNQ